MDTATSQTASIVPSEAKILLADDDPRMLDSLSALLSLYDYTVETALGGQEAIRKLVSNQYDLLLLDLKMPVVSGHDVMRYMSEHGIKTMTIVVSGESSLEDISKALRHGAYDYLKKPYVPEELTATVNNAVRKKLLEKANLAMQSRLNSSERLHRFIVNNSPDIIFILDQKGRFSFLNSKIEELLGYSRESLIGQSILQIIAQDDTDKAGYFFDQALTASSGIQSVEMSLQPFAKERSIRHFELSLWPIDDSKNNNDINSLQKYRLYGTARDITDRMEAEAFINFQAYHDLLTRLPNRALFKDRLSMAITQAQRNNDQLAVMFIDLDRFKIINDSLGHTMGDRLLQAVSQRMLTCIRKGDTLSRFGGDEFTLLLSDTQDKEAAIQVAEKILSSIKEPFPIGGHDIYVGASIGIAMYPESGATMDALIKNADIAMYRVKKTGKDGYQLFMNDMQAASTERLMLEQDMRRAIDSDEFEICYQPQIDTYNHKISGVEALIRWNHPTLGRLPPAEFIPIAEDSRLIIEIDRLTLRKACREIKLWHDTTMPDLRLCVNVSPLMLERNDFVDNILSIIQEEDYPAHLLELEITENILITDRHDIIDKLQRIRQRGIHLAIDDFGTGYSSLSYLQHFPISTLKIDRSFVTAIKNSSEEACIVNAIVSMAQGLKLSIVAEGVETQDQLSYLSTLGCHTVQGHLFGEADEIGRIAARVHSEIELLLESPQATQASSPELPG